jgi:hypothetical protein
MEDAEMTSLENEKVLIALATEARQSERDRFAARLEAGEEVGLQEAVAVLGILPSECWRLGAFCGRGRHGGLLQPHVTIPDFAWEYVRWQMDGIRCALVTREGEMIYDVWLRTSGAEEAFAEDDQLNDGMPLSGLVEPPGPAAFEPSIVLQSIIETKLPDGRQWTFVEYNFEFAKAGITVVRGKHDRVSGVTIGAGGRIERAGGSIHLTNALMVTRFTLAKSDGFLSNCRTKRDVARALYRWLAVAHPNIQGFRAEAADDLKTLDALTDLLRFHCGDFLEQVAGARPDQ